jgi:predicted phage-related endonuclease
VCGPAYTEAYVACYRPWTGFGLYGPIARDNELIGLIHDKAEKFQRDHLATNNPPTDAGETEAA